MKTIITLTLACALAVAVPAEDSAKKPAPPAAPVLAMAGAKITAPFVLRDGAVSQPSQTEVDAGGKAVLAFTVAQAGDYVIQAIVSAPDEDSNSFFLNIDAPPEDPLMIWDVAVTKDFEERIVSWRGNGDSFNDEFAPKVFKLAAGEHKLIIVGREPARLKSVSVRPAAR